MKTLREYINIVNESTSIDDWFSTGSFKTFKKPSRDPFEIATNSGTIDTLEGPMQYEKGHYIMTGPKGEKYPITPEKFAELKEDNGDGTASPKKIVKFAKLADHDGVLHTPWGDMNYTTGNDYIVKHGPNDYGAVKKDIFYKTYDTTNIKEE